MAPSCNPPRQPTDDMNQNQNELTLALDKPPFFSAAVCPLVSKIIEIRSEWLIFLVAFCWFGATTGLYPLLLPDEGRYVGVAWNMVGTENFFVPVMDGMPFFHKPPLFYWLTSLSLHVFGVNEWAGRLISVLGATATVSLAFWMLKTYANRRIAGVSVVILLSQPFLFGASHYANLDMTVAALIAATITAAATAVFRSEQDLPYRKPLLLAYALAALGFLAKGLIGVVLPAGVIFFWLIGRWRLDTLKRMISLPGFVLFLVVSVPWMYAMQQRYPDFFDYYIVHQHFERFLEKGFNNARPFWFYGPVLFGLLLPWSLHAWRLLRKSWWSAPAYPALNGLMISWFLVVFIFFSLPNSKLVGYVLPLVIPAAYFLALPFVDRLWGPQRARAIKTFSLSLLASLGICVTAVLVMMFFPQPSTKGLAQQLESRYESSDKIVMLDRYRYDLNFYLGTAKTSIVVADWNDPDLQKTDNWRRELFEAGQFTPDTAQRLLITRQELREKLCGKRAIALWLIGDDKSPERHGYLTDLPVTIQDGRLRGWLVSPEDQLNFCGETPTLSQE
jgi:hypothetical protein